MDADINLALVGLVALGGGLGSMARAALSGWMVPRLSAQSAVLVINATGSFAIGVSLGIVLSAMSIFDATSPPLWFMFFAVGILGGFTTVSTYALQIWELVQDGRMRPAALFALGSVVLCPAMTALGLLVTLKLARM